jgi:alpha-tubulin suppressor-like RCC1 family protein
LRRLLFVLAARAGGLTLLPAPAVAAPPSPGPSAPTEATPAPAPPAPPAPAPEGLLSGVRSVATGYYHSCAVLTNRQVRCWGYNGYGELGDGSGTEEIDSADVTKNASGTGPLLNVVQVVAGEYHTCALLANRQVRCWGAGDSGQIGNGETDDQPYPTTVRNVGDTGPLQNVVRISAESYGACALLANGQVRCWGDDDYGQLGNGGPKETSSLPVVVKGVGGVGALTNIASLSGGYDTNCAVTRGGQGRCWGYNTYGGLGNGSTSDTTVPVPVRAQSGQPLTGITQIANGGYHGCAVLSTKQLRCWGRNSSGELGTGNVDDSARARVVRSANGRALRNVTSVSVNQASTCALVTNGQVRCWGSDTYGENGDGTFAAPAFRKHPTPVRNIAGTANLSGVTQLAGKSYTYCVAIVNGQARCWGYGDYGGLGNGNDDDVPRPVLVIT